MLVDDVFSFSGDSVSCQKSTIYRTHTHTHTSAQLQQCLQYIKYTMGHGSNLLLIPIMCHAVSGKERRGENTLQVFSSQTRSFAMCAILLLLALSLRNMVKAVLVDHNKTGKTAGKYCGTLGLP